MVGFGLVERGNSSLIGIGGKRQWRHRLVVANAPYTRHSSGRTQAVSIFFFVFKKLYYCINLTARYLTRVYE